MLHHRALQHWKMPLPKNQFLLQLKQINSSSNLTNQESLLIMVNVEQALITVLSLLDMEVKMDLNITLSETLGDPHGVNLVILDLDTLEMAMEPAVFNYNLLTQLFDQIKLIISSNNYLG